MKQAKILAVALATVVALTVPARATEISGAGATFPYPIYAKWADAYKKETGIALNYQSIGSGGGIKQIIANTVTFGASDMPLKADELEKNGLIQFPTVLGGVVPVFNLEGVAANELVLNGDLLGKIFAGEITRWDDAAIKAINPTVKLPAQAIAVVHRSDASGTTFIFTDYLSKVSASWTLKVGVGTAVQWPVGIGAKGNEGVANMVMQTRGAIGYVEYAYAKQNNVKGARLVNKSGKTVAPDASAFRSAAENADWTGTPGFGVILTDQQGRDAWPIAGATFILMHKRPRDPVAAAETLRFFAWAYANGAKMAEELDYVAMPASVFAAVQEMWARDIKDSSGKAVLSPSR